MGAREETGEETRKERREEIGKKGGKKGGNSGLLPEEQELGVPVDSDNRALLRKLRARAFNPEGWLHPTVTGGKGEIPDDHRILGTALKFLLDAVKQSDEDGSPFGFQTGRQLVKRDLHHMVQGAYAALKARGVPGELIEFWVGEADQGIDSFRASVRYRLSEDGEYRVVDLKIPELEAFQQEVEELQEMEDGSGTESNANEDGEGIPEPPPTHGGGKLQ